MSAQRRGLGLPILLLWLVVDLAPGESCRSRQRGQRERPQGMVTEGPCLGSSFVIFPTISAVFLHWRVSPGPAPKSTTVIPQWSALLRKKTMFCQS